jgi:hypothetical protein
MPQIQLPCPIARRVGVKNIDLLKIIVSRFLYNMDKQTLFSPNFNIVSGCALTMTLLV